MISGRWFRVERCVKCDGRLSDHAVCYSNGVCPLCGNANNSTIVDTRKEVRRWVYSTRSRWWQFWRTAGRWEVKLAQRPQKGVES